MNRQLCGIAFLFIVDATVLMMNLVSSHCWAGDPPSWLDEVKVSATDSSSKVVRSPLPEFATRESLRQFQSETLEKWSKLLGTFDVSQTHPPNVTVIEKVEQEPGLIRTMIQYETEPGQSVQAFVLSPQASDGKKLPGVVVFHSTVGNSLFQPVGLSGPENAMVQPDELRKAFALHLARRGFVTISPRNFLWPQNVGIAAKEQTVAFHSRQPNRSGMSRMLLDAIRAVDVLCSMEQVDKTRIGAIGHSLGAKEVLYLAAFDSRIVATVSSEGGLGIGQSNWDAAWYLGQQCTQSNFVEDHHQLLAAVAPRAFLLVGGDSADGHESLPLLLEARKAYEVLGKAENLGFYNHKQGHAVTDISLARSLEWLQWQLSP